MEPMVAVVDDDEVDVYNLKSQPVVRPTPTPLPVPQPLMDMRDVMRVGAASPPQAVASSIQRSIFDESYLPTIRAIGAGAVAQACKGIAIARGHVAVRGLDLGVAIGFDNVPGDNGTEISAQTFRLFLR